MALPKPYLEISDKSMRQAVIVRADRECVFPSRDMTSGYEPIRRRGRGRRRKSFEEKNMRLLTRSNFDGLGCAVLLKALGLLDEIKFLFLILLGFVL